ncbi:MAG: muconolactone Delta-isomerase family protein [Capnocytophaga sp.]|nr:muconolactone Delta-isomerase family protein [Capnocytophaga sp.]
MNRIIVNITSDFSKVENAQEIIPEEIATTGKWKEQGILEHLLVKTDADTGGAVLIFQNQTKAEIEALLQTLPLRKCFVNVEFINVNKLH